MNSTTTDPISRAAVVEILVNDHDALVAYFDNLEHFKNQAQEIAQSLENP